MLVSFSTAGARGGPMFTGLVEAVGTVTATAADADGRLLTIAAPGVTDAAAQAVGDSIAVNGCCLTVVDRTADGAVRFQAGPETLRCTNLGALTVGSTVNLERAMLPTTRLGGHLVQGHVDGVGRVRSRETRGEWEFVWFDVGPLAAHLLPKGSVAVDGVSLTVVETTTDAFSVMLIPHTQTATTLGSRRIGDVVNLETDVLGKYVLNYLSRFFPQAAPLASSAQFLGAGS
ncbi:MAG: riboflavin synthase [Planctomycetia bacterium]